MPGMMKVRRLVAVGLAVSLLPAVAAAQGMKMGQAKMSTAKMTRMMKGWPTPSKEAAMAMVKKYGAPMHMSEHMAMWGKTGQWKRTIVYDYEVNHQFPGPHTDVMQQWIDMRVPPDMFDDLATYDGSVVVERTNGEISARCDKEGANFLALNLAYDIVSGKRSPDDARKMYAEQIMAMKAGKPAPYTEKLLFTPAMGGTSDPDKPAAMP